MLSFFSLSQPSGRLVVDRIDRQMKPANALYRDDFSLSQQPSGLCDYLVGARLDCVALVISQPNFRPALWAGDWLGVKTTVGYVVVLA